MIELIGVSKHYQLPTGTVTALDAVDLSVRPAEIFGIIGRSGAGKSSLIRCLNLLEKPTTGRVIVDAEDLTALDEAALRKARRKIGMIFQHFNLLSSRTVFQNVQLPLELTHLSRDEAHQRVTELLSLVDLADKKDVYIHQLSGGQKQRVAIARALANHPKVLLCDEATSALDPPMTQSILQLLKKINQTLGLTIVLITHEMEVLKNICHRVAVLEQGKIVEQNEIIDFFIHPKTAVGRTFVNQCMKLDLPPHLSSIMLSKASNSTQLPLLRISFKGNVAEEPLVASMIRRFELEVNILRANIEQIGNQTIGIMLVQVTGHPEKLTESIAFLKSKNVSVEVMGYVA